MSRWNMLLGGAVLCLTACGGHVVLETDQERYAPGAELKLRLQNESFVALGYNLCFSTLQRQEEGSWMAVPRPANEFCVAYQARLGPGGSTESTYPLSETLPEGLYRYVTSVEWSGEREEVTSNTFSVTHASTP